METVDSVRSLIARKLFDARKLIGDLDSRSWTLQEPAPALEEAEGSGSTQGCRATALHGRPYRAPKSLEAQASRPPA
jgi:hypothetical protein